MQYFNIALDIITTVWRCLKMEMNSLDKAKMEQTLLMDASSFKNQTNGSFKGNCVNYAKWKLSGSG